MIVKSHERTVWVDNRGRYVSKGEGRAVLRTFTSAPQPCVCCLPILVAATREVDGKTLCEECQA